MAIRYYLLGLIPIGLGELDEIGVSLRRLGKRELLVVRRGKQELTLGEKLAPTVAPKAWQDLVGDYVTANLDGDYPFIRSFRLDYEKGLEFLELRLNTQPELPLWMAIKPLSDNEALVLQTLANMGETLRVKRGPGGSAVLELSGYRYARQMRQ